MENKRTKKSFNYNYLSVILIYTISFLFLLSSSHIKEIGSRRFPVFMSIFAIILATILLLKTRFNWGKYDDPDFSGSGMAMVMAALLVGYVTFIEAVGFYLATPVYLYITMLILGQKKKILMIIISVSMSVVVYLFFQLLLNMEIPQGYLIPLLLG